ncbi:MAG: hypothetical protein KAJ19_20940 [Gammaproteobacteria bacterium]|nr:hypothetical protein [Gammaproteobacteria bacterium]
MQTRDFVLFAHGAFDGGISGRTALQKKVYFLGVMLGENHGFNPHYYGPYSAQVAEANSELKALNYLREDVHVYGWNHRGFEMAIYDYSLTEDGQKLLDRKKKQYPEKWRKISNFTTAIEGAGDLSYMELAIAAKAYYILTREGGMATKETIRSVAKNLGWSIKEMELDRAIDFLDKIHLAHWK